MPHGGPHGKNGGGKGKKNSPIEQVKSCVRAGLKKDPKAQVMPLAKSCAKQLGIKLKLK